MYQKTMLIGNVGADSEMRYMPDGTAVTNFSLATNKRWTNQATGEPAEQTTWWRCSVWGKQAETANEFINKGMKLFVEGEIQPDKDTGGPRTFTRQDGTVGASFELRVFGFKFLTTKEEMESMAGNGRNAAVPPAYTEEDEIPF